MKTLALSLLLALALPVMAAVGGTISQDALPKTWVAGEAPQAWPTDEVWLFECWASWCRPCLAAIPHMEELWQQVKGEGVRFVGVNVGDRKTPEQIKDFLIRQPVPPTYAIAVDDNVSTFARAVGVRGIPAAYAVKGGKVIWQGHPQSLTVEKLRELAKTTVEPDAAPEPPSPCGKH